MNEEYQEEQANETSDTQIVDEVWVQENNHNPDDVSDTESFLLAPEHDIVQTTQSNSRVQQSEQDQVNQQFDQTLRSEDFQKEKYLSLPNQYGMVKGRTSGCRKRKPGQVCCHWRYTEHGRNLRRTYSFPQTSRPYRLYPLPRSEYIKPVCARCLTSRPHTESTHFGDIPRSNSSRSITLFSGLFDWVKGLFSRPGSQTTNTPSVTEEHPVKESKAGKRSYDTLQRSSSMSVDKTRMSRPPSSAMPDLSSQVDISLDLQIDINEQPNSMPSTAVDTSPTFQTAIQASERTKQIDTATSYYTPRERTKSAPGPLDTMYQEDETGPMRMATGFTLSMNSVPSTAGTAYQTPSGPEKGVINEYNRLTDRKQPKLGLIDEKFKQNRSNTMSVTTMGSVIMTDSRSPSNLPSPNSEVNREDKPSSGNSTLRKSDNEQLTRTLEQINYLEHSPTEYIPMTTDKDISAESAISEQNGTIKLAKSPTHLEMHINQSTEPRPQSRKTRSPVIRKAEDQTGIEEPMTTTSAYADRNESEQWNDYTAPTKMPRLSSPVADTCNHEDNQCQSPTNERNNGYEDRQIENLTHSAPYITLAAFEHVSISESSSVHQGSVGSQDSERAPTTPRPSNEQNKDDSKGSNNAGWSENDGNPNEKDSELTRKKDSMMEDGGESSKYPESGLSISRLAKGNKLIDLEVKQEITLSNVEIPKDGSLQIETELRVRSPIASPLRKTFKNQLTEGYQKKEVDSGLGTSTERNQPAITTSSTNENEVNFEEPEAKKKKITTEENEAKNDAYSIDKVQQETELNNEPQAAQYGASTLEDSYHDTPLEMEIAGVHMEGEAQTLEQYRNPEIYQKEQNKREVHDDVTEQQTRDTLILDLQVGMKTSLTEDYNARAENTEYETSSTRGLLTAPSSHTDRTMQEKEQSRLTVALPEQVLDRNKTSEVDEMTGYNLYQDKTPTGGLLIPVDVANTNEDILQGENLDVRVIRENSQQALVGMQFTLTSPQAKGYVETEGQNLDNQPLEARRIDVKSSPLTTPIENITAAELRETASPEIQKGHKQTDMEKSLKLCDCNWPCYPNSASPQGRICAESTGFSNDMLCENTFQAHYRLQTPIDLSIGIQMRTEVGYFYNTTSADIVSNTQEIDERRPMTAEVPNTDEMHQEGMAEQADRVVTPNLVEEKMTVPLEKARSFHIDFQVTEPLLEEQTTTLLCAEPSIAIPETEQKQTQYDSKTDTKVEIAKAVSESYTFSRPHSRREIEDGHQTATPQYRIAVKSLIEMNSRPTSPSSIDVSLELRTNISALTEGSKANDAYLIRQGKITSTLDTFENLVDASEPVSRVKSPERAQNVVFNFKPDQKNPLTKSPEAVDDVIPNMDTAFSVEEQKDSWPHLEQSVSMLPEQGSVQSIRSKSMNEEDSSKLSPWERMECNYVVQWGTGSGGETDSEDEGKIIDVSFRGTKQEPTEIKDEIMRDHAKFDATPPPPGSSARSSSQVRELQLDNQLESADKCLEDMSDRKFKGEELHAKVDTEIKVQNSLLTTRVRAEVSVSIRHIETQKRSGQEKDRFRTDALEPLELIPPSQLRMESSSDTYVTALSSQPELVKVGTQSIDSEALDLERNEATEIGRMRNVYKSPVIAFTKRELEGEAAVKQLDDSVSPEHTTIQPISLQEVTDCKKIGGYMESDETRASGRNEREMRRNDMVNTVQTEGFIMTTELQWEAQPIEVGETILKHDIYLDIEALHEKSEFNKLEDFSGTNGVSQSEQTSGIRIPRKMQTKNYWNEEISLETSTAPTEHDKGWIHWKLESSLTDAAHSDSHQQTRTETFGSEYEKPIAHIDYKAETNSLTDGKNSNTLSLRMMQSTRAFRSTSADDRERKYKWSSEVSLAMSSRPESSLSLPYYADTGDVRIKSTRHTNWVDGTKSAYNYSMHYRDLSSPGRPSSPLEWSLGSTVFIPYSNRTISSESALPTSPTGYKLAQKSDASIRIGLKRHPIAVPSNHNVGKNILHYSNSNLPSPTEERPTSGTGKGQIQVTIAQQVMKGNELVRNDVQSFVLDSRTEQSIDTTKLTAGGTSALNSPSENIPTLLSEANQAAVARQITESAISKAMSRLSTTTPTASNRRELSGQRIEPSEDGEYVTVGRVAKLTTDGNIHVSSSIDMREHTRSPLTVALGALPQESVQMSPTSSAVTMHKNEQPDWDQANKQPGERGTNVTVRTNLRMSTPQTTMENTIGDEVFSATTNVSIDQDTIQSGQVVSSTWMNNLSTLEGETRLIEDQQCQLKGTMDIRLVTKSCLVVGPQVIPQTPTGQPLYLKTEVTSMRSPISSPEPRSPNQIQTEAESSAHEVSGMPKSRPGSPDTGVNDDTVWFEDQQGQISSGLDIHTVTKTSLLVSSPITSSDHDTRSSPPHVQTAEEPNARGRIISVKHEITLTRGTPIDRRMIESGQQRGALSANRMIGKTEAGDLSKAASPSSKLDPFLQSEKTGAVETPASVVANSPNEATAETSVMSYQMSPQLPSPDKLENQPVLDPAVEVKPEEMDVTGLKQDTNEQIESVNPIITEDTNIEQPNISGLVSTQGASEVELGVSPTSEPTYDLLEMLSPTSGETFSYGNADGKVLSALVTSTDPNTELQQQTEELTKLDETVGKSEQPREAQEETANGQAVPTTESKHGERLHVITHAIISSEPIETVNEETGEREQLVMPHLEIITETYEEAADGVQKLLNSSINVIRLTDDNAVTSDDKGTHMRSEIKTEPVTIAGKAIQIKQEISTEIIIDGGSKSRVTAHDENPPVPQDKIEEKPIEPDKIDIQATEQDKVPEVSRELMEHQEGEQSLEKPIESANVDPIEEIKVNIVVEVDKSEIQPRESPAPTSQAHPEEQETKIGEQKLELSTAAEDTRVEPIAEGPASNTLEPVQPTNTEEESPESVSHVQSENTEIKVGEQNLDLVIEKPDTTAENMDEIAALNTADIGPNEDVLKVEEQETKTTEQDIKMETHEKTNTISAELTLTLPESVVRTEIKTPTMTLEIQVKVVEQNREDVQEEIEAASPLENMETVHGVPEKPQNLEDIEGKSEQNALVSEQEQVVADEQVEGTDPMLTTHVSGTTLSPDPEIKAQDMAGVAAEQEMEDKEEKIEKIITSIEEEPSNRLASSEMLPDTLAAAETIPFTESPQKSGQAVEVEKKQENTVVMQANTNEDHPIEEKTDNEEADRIQGGQAELAEQKKDENEDQNAEVHLPVNQTLSETAVMEDTTGAVDLEAVTENEPQQQLVEPSQMETQLSLVQDQYKQQGESRLVSENIEEKSMTEITEEELLKQVQKAASEEPDQLQIAKIEPEDQEMIRLPGQNDYQPTEQVSVARKSEQPGFERIEITQHINLQESGVTPSRTEGKSTVTQVSTEFTLHIKPGEHPEISIISVASTAPERTMDEIEQVRTNSPIQIQNLPQSDNKDGDLEETSNLVGNVVSSAMIGEKSNTLNDLQTTLRQEDFENEQLEQLGGRESQTMGLTVDADREGIPIEQDILAPQVAEANLTDKGQGMIAGLRVMDIRDPRSSEIDERQAQLEAEELIQLAQPTNTNLGRETSEVEQSFVKGTITEPGQIKILEQTKEQAAKLLADLLKVGGESISKDTEIRMAEMIAPASDAVRVELTKQAKEKRDDQAGEMTDIEKQKLDMVINLAERVELVLEEAKTRFMSDLKQEASQSTTAQPLTVSQTEWLPDLTEEDRRRLETAAKSIEGMISLTNEERTMIAEEARAKLINGGDNLSEDEKKRLEAIISMAKEINDMTEKDKAAFIAQLQGEQQEPTSELQTEMRGTSDNDLSTGLRERTAESEQLANVPPGLTKAERILEELLQLDETSLTTDMTIAMAEKIAPLNDTERAELKQCANQKRDNLNIQLTEQDKQKLDAILEITQRMDEALLDAKNEFVAKMKNELPKYRTGSESDLNKAPETEFQNEVIEQQQQKYISDLPETERQRLESASKSLEGIASLSPEERQMLADDAKLRLMRDRDQLTDQQIQELEAILDMVNRVNEMTEEERSKLGSQWRGATNETAPEQIDMEHSLRVTEPDIQAGEQKRAGVDSEPSEEFHEQELSPQPEPAEIDKERQQIELISKLLSMTDEEREALIIEMTERLDKDIRQLHDTETENTWNVLSLAEQIAKMSPEEREALANEIENKLSPIYLEAQESVLRSESRMSQEESKRTFDLAGKDNDLEPVTEDISVNEFQPDMIKNEGTILADEGFAEQQLRPIEEDVLKETIGPKSQQTLVPEIEKSTTTKRRKRGRRTQEDSDSLDRHFNSMMGLCQRTCRRPDSRRFSLPARRRKNRVHKVTNILDALILQTIEYVKAHLPPPT